jgi:predicted phage terminase large subunit-like protein
MQQKLNASKAKAELCRRSLYEFVQEFWDVIIPEDPVWNWHIKYLCDEIQSDVMRVCRLKERPAIFEGMRFTMPAKPREPKLHDLLINVPPGSSKSTIVTIMMPAWAWSIDPTLRVISASYSGDLSQDHAVKSRDIIQSDKYKLYFPEIEIRADQNNKNNYKNTFGGERYATSVGGTIMGIHAHLLIIDDALNTKQSLSESDLPAAAAFVNTTLSTRKVDKSVSLTIMVMQRLNELDPAGVWLRMRDQEGKKLKHICLPVRSTDKVYPPELKERYVNGLLDPVRFTNEILDAARIELGSYGFAGQMAQDPAPEGGGVWQKWFIAVPDKDMPSPLQMTGYGTDWDTAYTSKSTNASSSAVVSGKVDHKMYIDQVCWFNKEFPDLLHMMRDNLPAPHYIEAKASGKSAKQTLDVAGIAAIEVQVQGDKLARARDATPHAESGKIYVRASILEKIYYDTDQGILKFPNGAKQDLADTIAQAIVRHFGKPERKFIVGWKLKTPVVREPAVIEVVSLIND